jgi:MFS family permease
MFRRNRGIFQGLTNMYAVNAQRIQHSFIYSMFGTGAGLGGPLGGYINDTFGWRTAFYFQIPLLVAASVLVLYHVHIVLPKAPLTIKQKLLQIDWLGSLTLVLFVGSLLLGLSLKTTEDLAWKDPRVWGLIVGSSVAFVGFVFAEAKVSPQPIMPLRLLMSRTPLAVALTNL